MKENLPRFLAQPELQDAPLESSRVSEAGNSCGAPEREREREREIHYVQYATHLENMSSS